MRTIPEKDWKYLSKIKQDMLNTLCLRIHKEAKKIIDFPDVEEIRKYHKLDIISILRLVDFENLFYFYQH